MNDKTWQQKPLSEKKSLIKEAGYQPNAYAYRVYHFIPQSVRNDIEYCISRNQKAKVLTHV